MEINNESILLNNTEKIDNKEEFIGTKQVLNNVLENGEQPNLTANATEVENNLSATEDSGSLGKFKSKEALLEAYNNLQKEFTKKCQKLSKLEKESITDLDSNCYEDKESLGEKENLDTINSTNSNSNEINITNVQNQSNEAELKVYERPDWNKKLAEFLQNNEDAKDYAKDISSLILENPELAEKEDALELAWGQVASKNYIKPEKIVNDKQFLDKYVLSNEDIKKQILEIYLKELKEQKVPTHITSIAGNNTPLSTSKGAKTLSEAKELVEKLFF